MRDLHTGGNPGGSGRVLQVCDVIGIRCDLDVGRGHRIGDAVDRDHAGAPFPRQPAYESADRFRGGIVGQHHRRLRIGKHRIEPLGVARKFRSKQRDRNVAGLDGGIETDHIVDALRGEDRDAIPRLGDLLQPCRYGLRALAKLCPVEIVGFAIGVRIEVQVSVRECVAQLFDGTLKVVVDGVTVWQGDSTFAVQVLLNA